MAEVIAAIEAVSPPPEVANWHNANLAVVQALKQAVDGQSADEALDPLLLFAVLPLAAAIEAAEASMAEDVRKRLVEAGCIDDLGGGGAVEEPETIEEPETLLGTFAIGEVARIGGYDVKVESYARTVPPEAQVHAVVINVGEIPLPVPDCRDMSLQDEGGSLASRGCGWNTTEDEIPPGGSVDYTLLYDVPKDATGLTWRFSIDREGVAFTLKEDPSLLSDRAALEALYNATDGPNWSDNTNWLSDAPLWEWYGVSTDRLLSHGDGRVTALSLSGNQLSGSIPPEVGNLSGLESLDLGGNQLSGSIPPELGNLSNLESLYLAWNELSGEVPLELGNLSNLSEVHLAANLSLSGCIPAGLQGLPYGDLPVHLGFCDA